ncbi:hypothetical protein SLEP1_g37710 [Rubroshorea leprosula]|uniref:Uncharacterized protein n=1 Tax=Rubroshorea leprosula TaxID=152421 RepID=A0AAV5KVI5_9ROSI|nr:hypothetical protein SLEP1_g37710 [Rubroshorea leprosula]
MKSGSVLKLMMKLVACSLLVILMSISVAANCGRRPGGDPGGNPPPSSYGGPGGTGGWTFTPGNPYMPCEGGFCPNGGSTSLQAILGPVTCLILLFYILLIV